MFKTSKTVKRELESYTIKSTDSIVKVQSADTIEGKCMVHSSNTYTKLKDVGAKDYYCRLEYKVDTGAFEPNRVAVYCNCAMPKNSDILMVKCDGCKDWFHPACLYMTIEAARNLDHFVCPECA